MSKAVKLKNSLYLASTSIVHKRGGGWHYLSDLLDNIYPVGSIHITTNNVNPSTYFGGIWEKLSGGYLYAAASIIEKTTYTGWGAQSTTLSIDQIPKHDHIFYYTTNSDGFASGRSVAARSSASNNIQKNGDYTFYSWTQTSGGGQGHTHNIATVDVFVWKRTA